MTVTTRRSGTSTRRAIAVIAGLNAVAAAAGGVSLALGVLSLGTEITARLPWASPVLGGVALLLWVAVPNAVLSVLAVRGSATTAPASVVVGTLLVAWILVQLAFIRELSFFHPLYVGVGGLLIWLGVRLAASHDGASGP
jgi:hypothetical protein